MKSSLWIALVITAFAVQFGQAKTIDRALPFDETTLPADGVTVLKIDNQADFDKYKNHTFAPGDVILDPMLLAPGTGGTKIDMTDPNRLSGYRLKPGSPCIDAGRSSGAGYVFGDRDFWGNPVPKGSGIDIGVHEFEAK